MDLHAIDWNATPWERVREGVERKAFSGEGATVSLNRLQPGHEPRPHSHPHEQIVYIMEGCIDFHIEGTGHAPFGRWPLGDPRRRAPLGRGGGRPSGAEPGRLHAQARRIRRLNRTGRASACLRPTP